MSYNWYSVHYGMWDFYPTKNPHHQHHIELSSLFSELRFRHICTYHSIPSTCTTFNHILTPRSIPLSNRHTPFTHSFIQGPDITREHGINRGLGDLFIPPPTHRTPQQYIETYTNIQVAWPPPPVPRPLLTPVPQVPPPHQFTQIDESRHTYNIHVILCNNNI